MAAVKIPDISTFSRQVFKLPTMASSKNEKNQELSDSLTSSHMYTAHKTLLVELNHKNKTEKNQELSDSLSCFMVKFN